MSESKDLKDLVAASFESLDRYEAAQEALAEDSERPPISGDVYVLEATKDFGVEWAVIARDPADPSSFLVVPADGHVLAGSADVELAEDSSAGALKLRCRFGAWTDGGLLRPELRIGRLSQEELERTRQRWLDLGDGNVTGDVLAREVDDDPSYQDWADDVLVAARRALLAAQSLEQAPGATAAETPTVEPTVSTATVSSAQRSQGSMFFRIAASIVVAVVSVQLWRLSDQVRNLETASRGAEERHGAAVRQLETERDRLTAERDRLHQEQQELVAAGAANEQEANKLRDRVAVLDRRLEEIARSSEIVNPAVTVFSPPEDAERGKYEMTLQPGQNHVVLFFLRPEPLPAPKYQIKVRAKGGKTVIWTNDQLVVQEPGEIRLVLPVRVLDQGEYQLELLALEGDVFRRVAEYELVVMTKSVS